MMEAAQKMMSNMKPEDMQRMTQMAANMDPKVMENMMKNMGNGAPPPGMDAAKALEQMKSMSPEQLQQGMSQAQRQMGAQKTYMVNAAEMLKNEGNAEVKAERYTEALAKYAKAIENLSGHAGADVGPIQVGLYNNSALCHLKLKDYGEAIKAGDEALKIDPKAYKALYRRGQAKAELGTLGEAVADVRTAAELSPGDKAIAAELTRLRGMLKEQGLKEEVVAPVKHAVRAEWQQPPADTPSTSSGSRASSSSSRANVGAPGTERWAKAAEQLVENPQVLKEATDLMSNMSPDELEKMMTSSGQKLPPGMDAATVKSQMEQLRKNPEMLKSAMESLQAMPEEDRKRMLSQSRVGGAGAEMAAAPKSGSEAMTAMFDNPELLQQAAAMTKNMNEEDLKKLNINSKDQADMMRSAMEQMASDPNLTKQMSEMMKSMGPQQLDEMMKMSSQMRGGEGGADPMGGMPAGADMDPSAMLNNPEMIKAAEQMMKNMSPEVLASMARANGLDMSEDKAKMVAKFLPYLMRLMRLFGYCKKGWSALWSKNGRIVLAVIVLCFALLQHYRSG